MVDNNSTETWNQMTFESVDHLRGTFDHVIFDWDIAPAMHINGTHWTGIFTNCIFRNMVDPSQWWAGRQFYLEPGTGSSADTVWCENNTFANMGFVYQTQGRPVHRTYYNHNTFVNVSKFAFLEAYWTWLVCTNNIFVNCHFTGERMADRAGQDTDGLLYGAVLNIDTLQIDTTTHQYPDNVQEQQRVIIFSNNSNYIDPAFQTFYNSYNDTIPAPERWIVAEPMMNSRTVQFFDGTFPHPFVKWANVYDGQDPGFTVSPTNMDSILFFLRTEYGAGANTNWGFHYDINGAWPLTENLSYTNSTLLTAGMNGLPLGDLNWFPNKLAGWTSAADQAIILPQTTSVRAIGGSVPGSYVLDQNYPNPFNPSTQITYSVPKKSFVSLKVFNSLGELVRTIVSGEQNAGTYQATIDGSNLSSGIYFYRLEAGDQVLSKKMVLMK